MQRKHIIIIGSIILLLAVVGYLGLRATSAPQSVKIGLILPLSGPGASWGNDYLQGATLAIEDLNARGVLDQPIELIVEDTQSEPKNAVTAFQKLIQIDKVSFIATTLSSHALVLKPLAEENRVLLFADAAHPAITDNSSYTFRHSNIVDDETRKLTDQISTLQAKQVGIIYSNDEYGSLENKQLTQHLAARGITTKSEAYDLTSTDFKTQISKLKDADTLVVVGLGPGFNIILRQIKEIGFAGNVLTGIAFVVFKSAELGTIVDGVYHTDFPYTSMNNWKEFSTKYKQKYNTDPKPYNVIPYSTMELLVTTITKADSNDPTKVAAKLRTLQEFKGTYETMLLNGKGDIIIPLLIRHYASERS